MKTKVQIKIFTVTSESVLPLKHITLHLHEKISTKIHVHMINVSCCISSSQHLDLHRLGQMSWTVKNLWGVLWGLRSPTQNILFFVAFSPASSCLSEGSVLMLPVCIVVAFASVVVFFLVFVLVFSWSSESVFSVTLFVLPFCSWDCFISSVFLRWVRKWESRKFGQSWTGHLHLCVVCPWWGLWVFISVAIILTWREAVESGQQLLLMFSVLRCPFLSCAHIIQDLRGNVFGFIVIS